MPLKYFKYVTIVRTPVITTLAHVNYFATDFCMYTEIYDGEIFDKSTMHLINTDCSKIWFLPMII